MKKMCVVVEYDEEVLVQKDVIDLLLESRGGLYRIKSHILLSPSNDRHKDALFRLDSFCNWVMRKCTIRQDSPFYVDEYLHAKVDEWYTGGDIKRWIKEEDNKDTLCFHQEEKGFMGPTEIELVPEDCSLSMNVEKGKLRDFKITIEHRRMAASELAKEPMGEHGTE
jgi:hypothetical protein